MYIYFDVYEEMTTSRVLTYFREDVTPALLADIAGIYGIDGGANFITMNDMAFQLAYWDHDYGWQFADGVDFNGVGGCISFA